MPLLYASSIKLDANSIFVTIAADTLSKNDLAKIRELIPDAELLPREVLRTVRAWLEAPTVDMDLRRKIVLEMEAMGIEIYESMLC